MTTTLRPITRETWVRTFEPPERLTVSEWADKYRMLSPESAAVAVQAGEPVPWSTDTVPYLREVMDTLSEARYREAVFVKSAQIAGTSAGENWIGWVIHQRPQPMLMVWPTEKKMRAFSTKRLDPMIRDTEVLAAILPKSGRRDSANTQESKQYPNGYLQLLTAKSTADLRSFSAGMLHVEEADEMEGEVGRQGDPLEMVRARAMTFAESMLFVVSTPLLEETSRVWPMYQGSTRGQYLVPCPFCGFAQALVWLDQQERYRLRFERDASGTLIPESVGYICEECGAIIPEVHKPAMLAAGHWHHELPDRARIGWRIWTAYSPFVSWVAICQKFLDSKAIPSQLKTFQNLWLGLPWKEIRGEIDATMLKGRAEQYPAEVPAGGRMLTAAVDVQVDRLELMICAWGLDEEVWVVCPGGEQAPYVFEGNPTEEAPWRAMLAEVFRPRRHESGALLVPVASGVDVSYLTDTAWSWARAYQARGVFPLRGGGKDHDPWIKAPAAQRQKRTRSRTEAETRPVWMVGDQQIKSSIYQRWQIKPKDPQRPGGPQVVHFPEGIDDGWFDQLTAEEVKTVIQGRHVIRRWIRLPHRRNEALDLLVYNFAAYAKLGSVGRQAIARGLVNVVGRWDDPENPAPGGSPAIPPLPPVLPGMGTAPARGRRVLSQGVDE